MPASPDDPPGFDVPLARLLDHRGLGADDLSRRFAVDAAELRAVRSGTTASPALVRQLAPALGLHVEDLFVIAGLDVPADLSPTDPDATTWLDTLVSAAMRLSAEDLEEVRRFIKALPRLPRTKPVAPPRPREQYPPGAGGMLVRMLHNRNLNWVASTGLLGMVPTSQIHWSAATLGMVGHGRKEVTPELLAILAPLLDVPAADLSALAGIDIPEAVPVPGPSASVMGELIWKARYLTRDQVVQARDKARSLLQG